MGTHFIVFEDAGNRIFGIEPLVFEQHTASDHGSFECCAPSAPERHSLLLHRRSRRLNGNRGVQNMVGSSHVGRHVHVRDIEGIRIVIKAVGRAIRRQELTHRDARHVKQVAHRLLVFGTREAAGRRPRCAAESRAFRRNQRRREFPRHGRPLRRRWPWLFRRRHLTRRDEVMHLHPGRECLGRLQVKSQPGEIEPTFARVVIVTIEAMFLEDRLRRGGRRAERGEQDGGTSEDSHRYDRVFFASSDHLQAAKRALAGRKLAGFDPQPLQH